MAARDPERTCVGCRERAPRGSLVRFVRDADARVRLDVARAEAGRGAWAHPRCAERAIESGSLARALRVGLEASEVARLLSETAAHAALEAVKEAAKEAEGVD